HYLSPALALLSIERQQLVFIAQLLKKISQIRAVLSGLKLVQTRVDQLALRLGELASHLVLELEDATQALPLASARVEHLDLLVNLAEEVRQRVLSVPLGIGQVAGRARGLLGGRNGHAGTSRIELALASVGLRVGAGARHDRVGEVANIVGGERLLGRV